MGPLGIFIGMEDYYAKADGSEKKFETSRKKFGGFEAKSAVLGV
jgi:hypothetical protein